MEETKITVKLYSALAPTAVAGQLEGLFLKRDAFLNHMIRIETPRLAEEMEGFSVSPKARRYIAGELKRMGVVPINVVVDKDVAAALNDVVDHTNMVRDAFMNRLILFLRSSEAILKRLGTSLYPSTVGTWVPGMWKCRQVRSKQWNRFSPTRSITSGPRLSMEETIRESIACRCRDSSSGFPAISMTYSCRLRTFTS